MMNELEKMAQDWEELMDEVANDDYFLDDDALDEMAQQFEYERMAEMGLALW